MTEIITIIGGGLSGSEAAWQVAKRGVKVRLYEMRPSQNTPAHRTDRLAEIVCSNSLKSDQPYNASWLLKEELRRLGSILLRIAEQVKVPAGAALAVDRDRFSAAVTQNLETHPNIEIVRAEVQSIPSEGIVIVASGPLTSPSLSESIRQFCGSDHLYFYDAISPIVNADTIDETKAYRANRYGRSSDDYINCPMDKDQYNSFYEALVGAESVTIHNFEQPQYFESCLPIEELARRGRETLRFGPMRPVGLEHPVTGKRPYAVVQLRQEDVMQSSYNIVGFQNHLKFGEQQRIFRMIPGLEQAEFLRLGQIHRNTYINAPQTLSPTMAARHDSRIFFAGQLAGTEGYVENIASGLVAGINAVRHLRSEVPLIMPIETAIGALCRYISTPQKHFAPMNINFGLLPTMALGKKTSRVDKQRLVCERALDSLPGDLVCPS